MAQELDSIELNQIFESLFGVCKVGAYRSSTAKLDRSQSLVPKPRYHHAMHCVALRISRSNLSESDFCRHMQSSLWEQGHTLSTGTVFEWYSFFDFFGFRRLGHL
jgi:hypothetical protein